MRMRSSRSQLVNKVIAYSQREKWRYEKDFNDVFVCTTGGNENSYKLAPGKHFALASWWLDRAHFDKDPLKTPFIRPGTRTYNCMSLHVLSGERTRRAAGLHSNRSADLSAQNAHT